MFAILQYFQDVWLARLILLVRHVKQDGHVRLKLQTVPIAIFVTLVILKTVLLYVFAILATSTTVQLVSMQILALHVNKVIHKTPKVYAMNV